MAWATPVLHAVGDVLTASDWNISSNDLSFLAGTTGATIASSQGGTSNTYVDLATPGPAVTLTTGTTAVVTLAAMIFNNTSGSASYMSFAVSGASTVAANDQTAIQMYQPPGALAGIQSGGSWFITGLTAGSNTFTAKYRVGANTGTWANRYITVFPLP